MFLLNRRQALSSIAALAGTGVLHPAAAQDYPSRPIRVIVPVGAGGATDIVARAFANELPSVLNQPVVVENRAGGSGVIGAMVVKQAPADGHTLLLGTIGTHSTNQHLLATMQYDATRDFAPITLLSKVSNVFYVNKDLPVQTMQEFVAYARKHPGQMSYGFGSGSSSHLALEMLKQRAGLEMVGVPYKAPDEATVDLIAGRLQVMCAPVIAVVAHIRSGKVKALAQTGDKRVIILPDVPTVGEAALPGFEASGWNGLFAPAGTPAAVLDTLSSAVRQVAVRPALQQVFMGQGVDVATTTPADFQRFLDQDQKNWGAVIKAAGIKPG